MKYLQLQYIGRRYYLLCLHQKIKELCKDKDVSIYQMCKETGIKENTVSNWKNRPEAKPSLENAILLSKFFDVSVDYFIKKES